MQQGNLNIGTIGQKFEAARQSKGVTVSEAGHATKILVKYIEAMEADDFGELAAPVYVKGFIRMYAQYLGLDAAPLVNEYLSQYAPRSKKVQLADDVRQKLVKADYTAGEGAAAAPKGKNKLSSIGSSMQTIGDGWPIKKILIGIGGLVLLLILFSGVQQCVGNDDSEPAPAGATMEHEVIEEVPDLFYSAPGESE